MTEPGVSWKLALVGLRRLVWEWDPLGFAELAPDDEYDCLLGPLVNRLSAGVDVPEIHDVLRHELTEHFGLTAAPPDLNAVASRIVAWWNAGEAPTTPLPRPENTGRLREGHDD